MSEQHSDKYERDFSGGCFYPSGCVDGQRCLEIGNCRYRAARETQSANGACSTCGAQPDQSCANLRSPCTRRGSNDLSPAVKEAIKKGPKPKHTPAWVDHGPERGQDYYYPAHTETAEDFATRIAMLAVQERNALPSSTGDTTPQESPLAWVVFTPNDPQGFDYRVFPEEREARSWASNDADSTFEPLYRASAFTRSATGDTTHPLCQSCSVSNNPRNGRCWSCGEKLPSHLNGRSI